MNNIGYRIELYDEDQLHSWIADWGDYYDKQDRGIFTGRPSIPFTFDELHNEIVRRNTIQLEVGGERFQM